VSLSGGNRPVMPAYNARMEGADPFGGLFGDPDDLQRRLGEFAEQMQGAQRVAWADNAIKLAVDMTVAAIHTIDLSGSPDEQAVQIRDAIRMIFPEAVTLVREAREGLA
jgi:Ethanolamine utilization protein EutJ (predicted chaperonin)